MQGRLTIYELELMDALWEIGEGTVRDVCEVHKRDLAYTTVMTSLNILHAKKSVVARDKQGRAFVYRPTVSREQMLRTVLDDLKPVFFTKSLPSIIVNLLSREQLDRDEITALKDALERAEKEGPDEPWQGC